MAAQDTFDNFIASLSHAERERLKDLIKLEREQLLSARSEDARLRLVHDFIVEVNDLAVTEK
ncbi:MAG: hypothetical protein AAB393_09775 [Bacteroidota bacterium]|mgnify:CR=1 FL=1